MTRLDSTGLIRIFIYIFISLELVIYVNSSTGLIDSTGLRLTRLDLTGLDRTRLESSELIWTQWLDWTLLDSFGYLYVYIFICLELVIYVNSSTGLNDSTGLMWTQLDSTGLEWNHLDSMTRLDSIGLIRIFIYKFISLELVIYVNSSTGLVDSTGLRWTQLDSTGLDWTHLDLSGLNDSSGLDRTH